MDSEFKPGQFVLYNGGIFRIRSVMYLTTGEPEPFLRLNDDLFVSARQVEKITETNIYDILPF